MYVFIVSALNFGFKLLNFKGNELRLRATTRAINSDLPCMAEDFKRISPPFFCSPFRLMSHDEQEEHRAASEHLDAVCC